MILVKALMSQKAGRVRVKKLEKQDLQEYLLKLVESMNTLRLD
jgi:hypothetical protein